MFIVYCPFHQQGRLLLQRLQPLVPPPPPPSVAGIAFYIVSDESGSGRIMVLISYDNTEHATEKKIYL